MSPSLYDKRRHLVVLLSLLTLTLTAGLSTADAAAATVSFYPSPEAAAAAHCDGTLYPDLCLSTLATIPNLHKKPLRVVIGATCNRTETEVTDMSANCSSYLQESSLPARDRLAVSDCIELLDDTMDDLRATTSDLEQRLSTSSRPMMHEVMTVLSAAITNQQTCLEGFAYQKGGHLRRLIEPRINHISRLVSNSLALARKLPGANASSTSTSSMESMQRQPFMGYGQMVKGFPRWVRPGNRRLLQAPASGIKADAVVAKDGSGAYTTVSAAVAAAPTNSKTRYVIYIKAGTYMENVEVGKKHKNLMFIGDGIGKTVIKASLNVVDGSTTFRSATVGKLRFTSYPYCAALVLIFQEYNIACYNPSNPSLSTYVQLPGVYHDLIQLGSSNPPNNVSYRGVNGINISDFE
jgi:pectinesterase